MPTVATRLPIQKAWKFCPMCGHPRRGRKASPFRCVACDYTHFFGPVSAVGAITTDQQGQVLLLIRGKDPGKGRFGLPGGFVDPGETAEEALHREVFEEVRLRVTSMAYLASFPNSYVFHGHELPVTDMFFVVTVQSFDPLQVQAGEIDAWHFCHPGRRELRRMAFESNRRALSVFLRTVRQRKQT